MTRVNVVHDEEIENIHLLAEYKEITRVFTQRRNAIKSKRIINVPKQYVLGNGHQSFFTDKLQWCLNRYHLLNQELRKRGYGTNPVPDNLLKEWIDSRFFRDYNVTHEAVELNRQRIQKRLEGDKS